MEDAINEKFLIKIKFLLGTKKIKEMQKKRKLVKYITGMIGF